MVIKQPNEVHFMVDHGEGGVLGAVILPLTDGCKGKVIRFRGPKGCRFEMNHDADETVIVIDGRIKLLFDGSEVELSAGGIYHVPANEKYDVVMVEGADLVSVFSGPGIFPLHDQIL